ncbi:MAG: rRNA cytosine-C5-methylase, partial [Commensalibacter sp.]|nr:rRNA cytosine-C5-methylase [Commensalibacter sp.]
MTPAARISAVIELLEIIEKEFQTPADAIANRFFRNRRYIGGGDRRLVSAQLWEIMRHHRRLKWWLKRIACPISPRMMVAAFEILTGKNVKQVQELFSGERYAPLSLS